MNNNVKIALGVAGIAAVAGAVYLMNRKDGLNVKTVGAIGDGITNDTDAIQKAIDYSNDVYIPKGKYVVDTLNLKEGTNIYGDGFLQTVLIHTSKETDSSALMSAMSSSPEEKIKSIKISNLALDGQSDKLGFSEFKHLVYLMGVDNVLINNVLFQGFRGDGVNMGGVSLPDYGIRHNSNVVIKNSKFDGAGKANRNPISIIDCTGLLIEKCRFVNATQKNMPSAIDFEPDMSYNKISDCVVNNCYFEDIGGNLGVIGINIGDFEYETYPTNIHITNNTIKNCSNDNALTYQYAKTNGIESEQAITNLVWENNQIFNCQSPFFLSNGNDVTILGNKFYDCSRAALISYPNYGGEVGRNILIKLNDFVRVGDKSGVGLNLFSVDNIIIEQNNFIDCGSGKESMNYAINFNKGESKNIIIRNNNFESEEGKTKFAVMNDREHKFDEQTNKFYNNRLNGLESTFKHI